MARAFVRNAADPRQVKRGAKKERDRRADYLGYLRHAMTSSAVRYVFAELLERGLFHEPLFTGNEPFQVVAWREGRRAFVLELRKELLEADQDAVALMDAEARRRAKNRDFEIDASDAALEREGDPDRALYTTEEER